MREHDAEVSPPIRVFRRNLSSRRRYYAEADAIFVSVPKSGRTWLRVFLYRYYSATYGVKFTLDEKEIFAGRLPKLIFTHDFWEHRATARPKDRWRGKHLVPPRAVLEKKIVLIARDPRDLLVSLFFQQSKRMHRYKGTLSDMLRHPRFGVRLIVEVMNLWMKEWGGRTNCKLVRYEDCKRDAAATFRELVAFLSAAGVDEAAFRGALEFSSFDNMKAMEAAGKFDTRILKPGDRADPESFKVRRGQVGGYGEYFTDADLEYIKGELARLDERYGYR
ncbi:MAG TPA: sulfotransferase domain-containing protein [Candidatus Binatia bacterium]|jgi:hypothetical protein